MLPRLVMTRPLRADQMARLSRRRAGSASVAMAETGRVAAVVMVKGHTAAATAMAAAAAAVAAAAASCACACACSSPCSGDQLARVPAQPPNHNHITITITLIQDVSRLNGVVSAFFGLLDSILSLAALVPVLFVLQWELGMCMCMCMYVCMCMCMCTCLVPALSSSVG